MTIDRVSISFKAKPTVKIGGESFDVSKKETFDKTVTIGGKKYPAIQIDNNTYLALTKKGGAFSNYRLDIVSTDPQDLEKWNVKIGGGKINQVGHLRDTFTAKKAETVHGTFNFNDQFAQNFRRQAESKIGQKLRKAGLTINDEQLYQLRKRGIFDVRMYVKLTNNKINKDERQNMLNDLLDGPIQNELSLNLSEPTNRNQSAIPSSPTRPNLQTTNSMVSSGSAPLIPSSNNMNPINGAKEFEFDYDDKILALLEIRLDLSKRVRKYDFKVQQEFNKLRDGYQNRKDDSDLGGWAKKFMQFEEKLNKLDSSRDSFDSPSNKIQLDDEYDIPSKKIQVEDEYIDFDDEDAWGDKELIPNGHQLDNSSKENNSKSLQDIKKHNQSQAEQYLSKNKQVIDNLVTKAMGKTKEIPNKDELSGLKAHIIKAFGDSNKEIDPKAVEPFALAATRNYLEKNLLI